MVSSISQILDVAFKRIQFTPDLMPSDITGTMILDEQERGRREFRFVRGPVEEPYGTVGVFEDLYGNRFDLIQRRSPSPR